MDGSKNITGIAIAGAEALIAWAVQAAPGARVVYWLGDLAFDKAGRKGTAIAGAARQISNAAMQLAADGKVLLVQRRTGGGDFAYEAVKAHPPKVEAGDVRGAPQLTRSRIPDR